MLFWFLAILAPHSVTTTRTRNEAAWREQHGPRQALFISQRLPATSTATASVIATATATTATPFFPRLGFIHLQGPAIMHSVVEALNSLLGISPILHLHETETFALARVAIHD
jgi:hypothetical protein